MSKVIFIRSAEKIGALILSLFGYVFAFFASIIFLMPCALLVFLPERYRYDNPLLFWLLDKWYRGMVYSFMLPMAIKGTGNIPRGPAIFIANHESSLDIPLMGMLMQGRPHMWYVSDYYEKTPILSFFVRRLGVFVERASTSSAARTLVKGIRLVQGHNRNTIIFPEGGRFNDGTIHTFFEGFAFIAKKTGYPIVPVLLQNTGKIYPPRSFLAHRYPLIISIGLPVQFSEGDSIKSITDRLYAYFVHQNEDREKIEVK